MRIAIRLLAATALFALPVAAQAHRQWMVPSATVFSGTGQSVSVDAAASNDLFFPDHRPMQLESIKVWAPDGTPGAIINGSSGAHRSTFDVKLDKPGTWKIGTLNSNVSGTVKINGVEHRVGGRRGGMGPGGQAAPTVELGAIPPTATDVKLTESISRNEIYVTADQPSDTVMKPSGKGLELQPVTQLDSLVAGEKARLRFLVDGQPAKALKVTVVPGGKRYRNDDGAVEYVTGADGVATIDWPTAGMYWINASMTDDKPSDSRASRRRLSYTTTVEVLLP